MSLLQIQRVFKGSLELRKCFSVNHKISEPKDSLNRIHSQIGHK